MNTNVEQLHLSRRAPHSLEIEQALLGAVLVNNDTLNDFQDFLHSDHFFEPVHGRIYSAILRLRSRMMAADPIRLKTFFEDDEDLQDVGGAAYLVRLASSAATLLHVTDYAKAIYEMAAKRDLIDIANDLADQSYQPSQELEIGEIVSNTEAQLYQVVVANERQSACVSLSTAIGVAVEHIERAYQDPNKLAGITTGLHDLDEMIGGLHDSDLIILAGRPAMGKTALALNIAFSAAHRLAIDRKQDIDASHSKGAVVAFFSLEMSSDQLAGRLLAERSGVQGQDLRRGKITASQFEDVARAAMELEEVPLYIDDTPGVSITALKNKARRLQRKEEGLGLLVIDYLQLLKGSGKGSSKENRVQEISDITRGLKEIAKELKIPVIALSQLSRMVEQREVKRPMLSDLRESGSIEQDADMVFFVYREEYYLEKTKPIEGTDQHAQWMQKMNDVYGTAEIIIGKQRHGPTGDVKVHFDKSTTKFSDYITEDRLPEKR